MTPQEKLKEIEEAHEKDELHNPEMDWLISRVKQLEWALGPGCYCGEYDSRNNPCDCCKALTTDPLEKLK